MTLSELIAALERADGPSRELDSAICAEMGLENWTAAEWAEAVSGVGREHWSIPGSLPYTSSIDAALTLVPEGCYWAVYRSGMAYVKPDEDGPQERDLAAAATPALALCIAALKARGSDD